MGFLFPEGLANPAQSILYFHESKTFVSICVAFASLYVTFTGYPVVSTFKESDLNSESTNTAAREGPEQRENCGASTC